MVHGLRRSRMRRGVPSESDGVRQEQSDEGSVPPVSDLTSDGGNENGGNEHEEEAEIMYMYIGGGRAEVALAENEATKALAGLLEGGDIVCTADDYGGFEKVGGARAFPSREQFAH